MESFQGKLVQGGLIVSEDVAGLLQGDPAIGAGWWGTLTLPGDDRVRPGDHYTLCLSDGRSGILLLKTATFFAGSDTRALFEGQGLLR